jgi:hypothetical protein
MFGSRGEAREIRVLSVDHGIYPEIGPLNPGFSRDGRKIRVSFEIQRDLASDLLRAGPAFSSAVIRVCPTLAHHACRAGTEGIAPLDPAHFGQICGRRLAEDPVDVAHLLEHIVIDLVVAISRMSRCSGVTCALREPQNRFHLFVECEDASVGSLAFRIGSDVLVHLLRSTGDPERFRRCVRLAQWWVGRDGGSHALAEFAGSLSWPEATARQAAEDLAGFGFLEPSRLSFNYSGLDYYARSRGVQLGFPTQQS